MSSLRSRSGGSLRTTTFSRKNKILPERSFANHCIQRTVGGADDADVHRTGSEIADGHDALFLQHAQKLGLKMQAQFGDFIEKQRSTIGGTNEAERITGRPGERTFHVPEQFAFKERVAQRRAIDGIKGFVSAR